MKLAGLYKPVDDNKKRRHSFECRRFLLADSRYNFPARFSLFCSMRSYCSKKVGSILIGIRLLQMMSRFGLRMNIVGLPVS